MLDDSPSWQTHLPRQVQEPLLQFYSEEELQHICRALARPPLTTSVRVNTMQTSREQLMHDLTAELRALVPGTEGAEPAWTGAETPYGTVEAHPLIADCVLIRPQNKAVNTVMPCGRELLVSRRCAEAVLRGAHVYIPGMVGCSPHCAAGDQVTVLCDVHDRFLRGSSTHILSTRKLDPKRMKGCAMKKMGLDALSVRNKKNRHDRVHETLDEDPSKVDAVRAQFRGENERLDHRFGDLRHPSYGDKDPEQAPSLPDGIVVLGRGVMTVDKKEAFTSSDGVGCRMTQCVFRAPPLNGMLASRMYIQNLPSMVVPHVLDPQEGERVLDMCASPGGKATHVAALLKGSGQVIALDRTEAKVGIIRQRASELGLPNIECFKADATLLVARNDAAAAEWTSQAKDAEHKKKEGGKRGQRAGGRESAGGQAEGKEPFRLQEESFDRIVLDPPCTALGLRPRLSVDVTAAEMARTHGYQRRMLHVACALLKPGGRLVYSTCTMNPLENESNVAYAIRSLPLRLIAAEPRVGPPGRKGCGLTEEERQMVQRFEPDGELDTNGFFIAAFQKIV